MEEDRKDGNNNFLVPISIVVGALIVAASIIYHGAMFGDIPSGSGNETVEAEGRTELAVTDDDFIRGAKDAPVTIVEFSDLQCPFCRTFHSTVKQALEVYGSDVRWVYRHFPLDSIHPQATPAALAAECIGEQQGDTGFWAFTDLMFENQEQLGAAYYRQIAAQIGADLQEFDQCVAEGRYNEKIHEQYQLGVRLGVEGTPGSFINGTSIPGAIPFDENSEGYRPGMPTLKSYIDQELENI